MFARARSISPRWKGIMLAAGALLAATAAAGGVRASAGKCKPVSGKFSLVTFSGPDCASPVGLCGQVEWKGDLAGTSSFVATSTIVTADTPSTSVVLVTGDNTLQLEGGTLLTKDAVVFRTTGAGEFAEVDTVVGGTGAWAGFTGAWRAQGTFTGNTGTGDYQGELCAP